MNEARAQESASTGGGEAVPRLRLRSLKVHAFRDVRPGTELVFGDGFHLILGKNGTGKSTLLRLIAAVSALDFREAFFEDAPLHLEATYSIGTLDLYCEIRREFPRTEESVEAKEPFSVLSKPAVVMQVVARTEIPEASFTQWLLARTGEGIFVTSQDPRNVDLSRVKPRFHKFLSDPARLSLHWAILLTTSIPPTGGPGLRPEAISAWARVVARPSTPVPFDEALGALNAITGSQLTVFRSEQDRSTSPWLPPALDFNASGEPVLLTVGTEPLLDEVVDLVGYDEAKMYFGPGGAHLHGWEYSSPSFQFFRNGRVVRRHDQLSFGQQRLFSFAWYLACNPDVVIADEVVNGLHSEWIDWCVEKMRDRQCFLTSQNPLLVDAVGSELSPGDDLARRIILCEASPAGELSFRQLDARESQILGDALQESRLDLLSDLLHALDLW